MMFFNKGISNSLYKKYNKNLQDDGEKVIIS